MVLSTPENSPCGGKSYAHQLEKRLTLKRVDASFPMDGAPVVSLDCP